ncbi:MAG: type II toxin-antitoxin system Phd/YefM family antitoxin [Verrucomicrobiales bacterium]|nr:type II toxin-antitoxin system Phd/YefM family antitoxin [Verrucomicrobiales bacterium]
MKTIKKNKLLKTKPLTPSWPAPVVDEDDEDSDAPVTRLRESMAVPLSIAKLPSIGESIGIRSAKAHLSALVAMVEKGKNLVLMRDGSPVAKLVPYEKPAYKPFEIDEDFLFSQPISTGPSATEIIRKERDSRY